jgi:hypothetical protein
MRVQVLEDFYIPGQPQVQRGVEIDVPDRTAETLISRGLVKQLRKDTTEDKKTPETPKSDELEASIVEDKPEESKKDKKLKK